MQQRTNISEDAPLSYIEFLLISCALLSIMDAPPLYTPVLPLLRAATNECQKTLNKCETRNKTVFHTRLRHPETINSVLLNSVLRNKQIGV